MKKWILILVIVIFNASCKDKQAAPVEAEHPLGTTPAADNAPPASKTTSSKSIADLEQQKERERETNLIPEKELQLFLNDWLASQNTGSFETYTSFYAKKFEGIKRAGRGIFRFNRKKWLKDRGRMFKNKIVVEADAVEFVRTPHLSAIKFNQKWSDMDYSDYGPKQLLVQKEAGQLKIIKEEMLKSEILGGPRKKKTLDFLRKFFLVVDDSYIVFEKFRKHKQIKKVEYMAGENARKPISPDIIDAYYQSMAQGSFTVGFTDGSRAEVKPDGVFAITQVIPHGQQSQNWHEENVPMVQRAKQLFDLAGDNVYLSVKIKLPAGKRALWAIPNSAPKPTVYSDRVLTSDAYEPMYALASSSAESQKIQKRFLNHDRTGNWLEADARVVAKEFESPDKTVKIGFIQMSAGMGCGDFYDSMQEYYNLSDNTPKGLGKPVDFYHGSFVDSHIPSQAIDIDRDGFPEFVSNGKLMYLSGKKWYLYEIETSYYDCPC